MNDSFRPAPVWRRHEVMLLIAILVVMVLTTLVDASHAYWNQPRVCAINLTRQATILGLYSLGAAIVIIAGGIDLSIGSVMAFSATICALQLVWLSPESFRPSTVSSPAPPLGTAVIATAITGTLMVGFLIGTLHAWLITRIGLPPFVATLGTLVGLRSLSRAVTENLTETLLGGKSTKFDVNDRGFRELTGAVSGTTVNLIVMTLVVGIVLWVFMSKTIPGRHLYAIGGNEQAARLSGIRTDRMKWAAYCICSVLSSLAGMISLSQLAGTDPQTLGRGYELNAIAAAVVGGCSLQGGVGTIPGTMLGAIFLCVVIDGVAKIIKTGADVYEGLIVGVLVVFAVTFTRSAERAASRSRLFDGAMGWVTLVALSLLSGVLMAMLGVQFVKGRIQMSPVWLGGLAVILTSLLLLIVRSSVSPPVKQRWGAAWAVLAIVAIIGGEVAFPRVQRRSAVAFVQQLNGRVSEREDGIVVNLSNTETTDAVLKQLLPRLRYFSSVSELDLSGTRVTDASLDPITNTFQSTGILKRLRAENTKLSPATRERLKSRISSLIEVTP